jgi:tetratricopeptide (TPR) repeat protein
MRLTRTARFAALSLGLAVAMFLTAAVAVSRGSSGSAAPIGRSPSDAIAGELANPGDLSSTIAALQHRLRRIPQDAGSWAALGSTYIQQARVTGDPSFYPKAAGTLRRSLVVQPDLNAPALTGLAALAAGRHEFGRALSLARQSEQINPYGSVNLGVLVDALVELGRYRQATAACQRMLDLKPAVPSYTRASYLFELKGDLDGADFAMRRALQIGYSADDRAFAYFQLGELAWNAGKVDRAGHFYRQGLQEDASYVPLLYGKAKVEAASGDPAQAVRDFQTVVDRYPSPTYVIEFADLLDSLGRDGRARQQRSLLRAQERIFRAAGVNLDLELALYDADHGRAAAALASAKRAFHARQGVFVEDAYAWALHMNGLDRAALRHSEHAARIGTRSALLAYHRGMIERSLGRTASAAASLRAALRTNPHFSWTLAPKARAALAALTTAEGAR